MPAMNPNELRERTRQFALRILRLTDILPKKLGAQTIGRQLVRSGTSVGANYRAACRARSSAEFRAKLGIVEEEADESSYWIGLLADAGYVKPDLVQDLLDEANALTAIMVASIRTSRRKAETKKR